MIVRSDGRIEINSQLARAFGFKSAPKMLADLQSGGTGIEAEGFAALKSEIEAAIASASRFAVKVRVAELLSRV